VKELWWSEGREEEERKLIRKLGESGVLPMEAQNPRNEERCVESIRGAPQIVA